LFLKRAKMALALVRAGEIGVTGRNEVPGVGQEPVRRSAIAFSGKKARSLKRAPEPVRRAVAEKVAAIKLEKTSTPEQVVAELSQLGCQIALTRCFRAKWELWYFSDEDGLLTSFVFIEGVPGLFRMMSKYYSVLPADSKPAKGNSSPRLQTQTATA
jgi:hypothetical protein